MLILTSPAKTQDYSPDWRAEQVSSPHFQREANALHKALLPLDKAELQDLMKISQKLAEGVSDYLDQWTGNPDSARAKPAILAYQGDVYRQLTAAEWNAREQAYAQRSLRILTGMYGWLRPYDRIEAYRLEMKTKLKTPGAKDLVDFWRERITAAAKAEIAKQGHSLIVNLASQEYSQAVDFSQLDATVVEPRFYTEKHGKRSILGIIAKRARGTMIEWLVRQQSPDDAQALERFAEDGWGFERWEGNAMAFLRGNT